MNSRILIVEDDPDLRQWYKSRLAAKHYELFFAADGLASISQAQQHRPDLIVLDLGLPGGDGFSVIERLKAIPHLAVIPVIVVSGRFQDRTRALQAGAMGFIHKPVDKDLLLVLIEKFLNESSESSYAERSASEL